VSLSGGGSPDAPLHWRLRTSTSRTCWPRQAMTPAWLSEVAEERPLIRLVDDEQ
jgi:hypothetical protein